MPDVLMTCPICSQALRAIPDASPESAPYVCDTDARGFWGTELTTEARAAFDPRLRAYTAPVIRSKVAAAIVEERLRARGRGQGNPPLNLPIDDLPTLPKGGKN